MAVEVIGNARKQKKIITLIIAIIHLAIGDKENKAHSCLELQIQQCPEV